MKCLRYMAGRHSCWRCTTVRQNSVLLMRWIR